MIHWQSSLPSSHSLRLLGPIVLIGHRGSGKTTLGSALAEFLQLPFHDIDEKLRLTLGKEFSSTLNKSPETFRNLEEKLLEESLSCTDPLIISPGAGARPSPEKGLLIWLQREDWRDEVRKSARPRVRPELSEEEEWQWMIETREPNWLKDAHLTLQIPRGRSLEQSLQELFALIHFATSMRAHRITKKTYLVPRDETEWQRANTDARRFGFAGLEVRSDRFPGGIKKRDLPYIASLRHNDPSWFFRCREPRIWDIDLLYFADVLKVLPRRVPADLLVSTHPKEVRGEDVEALAQAARALKEKGVPLSSIILKYAPQVKDFEELRRCLALGETLRAIPTKTILLPQGKNVQWLRPILGRENAVNYLPLGLSRGDGHPSTLDLNGFLPHLASPEATTFDALVGDPVEASQGDRWHRSYSLCHQGEEHRGYLKIPVNRGAFSQALSLFEELPLRGISITSPLKKEAAQAPFVDPQGLPALNTLRPLREEGETAHPLTQTGWIGTDTDQAGMEALLEEIAQQGYSPGRALVFGRGGASFAVVRALKAQGWSIKAHLSARAGWQSMPSDLKAVDLIVNAAGPELAYRNTAAIPEAKIWVDLHYQRVSPPPQPVALHLQGDLFFNAQALAQREFWNLSESDKDESK